MKCQLCKANEATIHLKEIKENLVSEVHLCQSCFQQRTEEETAADTVAAPLSLAASLEQASDFQAQHGAKPASDLSCPSCGLAFSDFLEQGRLGCSTCYTAFGEQLRPFLQKIHGSTHHVGKRPRQETKSLDLRHTLSRLQGELDKAIQEENYERAATLRDEIREFEETQAAEARDA